MSSYTFQQFQADYPNDAACLAKLMEMNYGGTHIVCPACGVEANFHPMTKRRAYACQECGHHIYPCADTIFHKSRTPLTKWFFAMYLMTSTRHGVAAKEIERQIGVTYKTAWRMCHEFRKLMASADGNAPLGGPDKPVEIDETFVGGKGKGHKSKGRGSKKAIVFGLAERDGDIRTGTIPDVKARSVEPIVLANVRRGSALYSDTNTSYRHLAKKGGFTHEKVNHQREEWARGPVHVNSLEGHWSLLKRAIRGTHTNVSRKHLWKYLSEFSYRRNHRHSHAGMFNRLVAAFSLPRLADD